MEQSAGSKLVGAAAELLSSGVRGPEESKLVAPIKLAGEVGRAERAAPAASDGVVLKRKRGRPAKGVPKTAPPPRQQQVEDEEDVCFICFDGGSLVLCDRRGCPKAYHPACVKRDEAFFSSTAKWNCGWHICSTCQKASHYMCYTCTYSVCKGCTYDADFVFVRGNKGLCGICMKTIMMIENSAEGNKDKCEVDFDDKTSWEYLFKVYWIYLKEKLSLTFDEILRARNTCKVAAPMSCKVQTPHELYHLKDDKSSGSENSCIDSESNNWKNKKTKRQQKLLSKADCSDRTTSGSDTGLSLHECTKWASKELLEFVAHMKNGDTSLLSQFDVQTLLLEYVKKNNLRDPQQKSQIVCDSRLLTLFGKARVGYIEMLVLLESHFLIKDNSGAANTFGAAIIDAAANEGEAIDDYNKQLMLVNDKRCITNKKADMLVTQHNPDAYAAIDPHNINLIYLRRNLVESLIVDTEKINEKVAGSFVRIRISSGDQKQDMYRLVQVVGTSKVAEHYQIGTRTTDIKLEILNLNRKEVISIDEISNQEFSEDECKRLRQSIKYGLSKRLTVGEILDRALTLQAIRVNDLLEAEILRLNHLRDRANEKGHRKELKECVEKLQILNSPDERQRRLREIPDVHSDPNLDSLFESDEDAGESDDSKQAGNVRSKHPGSDKRERAPIFARIWDGALNNVGCRTQDLTTTSDPIGNKCTSKNHTNPNGAAIEDSTNVVVKSEASCVAVDISPSLPSTGIEQPFDDHLNDRSWHYQDPTGKVQGPFSMFQLYKWNASGHFPPDLRVWRIDEKQDNSILLSNALNRKCSENVSLGASLTLEDKESSQDGGRNATKNDICSDSQIIEQSRELKVDDTSMESNGKDESIRSNGWHDQLHVNPSPPPSAVTENLNDNPSGKLREGHGIEGKSEDNGNYDSHRTSDGQSNSGQSYKKRSDSEDNSGQSSGQNWKHLNLNSSSTCLVTTSDHDSGTKTSPRKLGFDLHKPPSPPLFNTTWQAIIGEPDDFDESVSDLLAEVEAMESLGGLESPTSIMKRSEDLADSSKHDCFSFIELSPMLDAGKSDALSSTGNLHLPSQSTVAEEPLRQAHTHPHHHQRISGEHSSTSSEVVVGMKNIGVSGNQWESGSGNSPIVPTTVTLGMAIDTTWRLGTENTDLGWGVEQMAVHENRSSSSHTSVVTPSLGDSQTRYGSDRCSVPQRETNMSWGVAQMAVHENRSSNSHTSVVTPSLGDSQTRYGSDRCSVPRDRSFPGHGRESGLGRVRSASNRQSLFGVGNGGSYRASPKGQRVCKFYESGYCKKGSSCSYLHP